MKKQLQHLVGFVKCLMNHISYNKGCYIGLNVKITNSGGVILGKNVIIRPSTGIGAYASNSKIIFGDNVEIGKQSSIAAINEVVFENGVLTGPHVFISDHNHEYRNVNLPVYKQGISYADNGKVVIGEGSWLGTNVVIVGNVHIGKHCVIGANSVVTEDIPDYSVAAGIPAKVIKRYDFEKEEWIKMK